MIPFPWQELAGFIIQVPALDPSVYCLKISKSFGTNHVSGKNLNSSGYFFFNLFIFLVKKCLFPN